jgi:hypothetical protein
MIHLPHPRLLLRRRASLAELGRIYRDMIYSWQPSGPWIFIIGEYKMDYLVAAYAAIWLFFIGYFALTISRSLAAAREIASLVQSGAPDEAKAPQSGVK